MGESRQPSHQDPSRKPDLSLVIPCYNEEGSIRNSAGRLVQSFREKDINLELVLVDNGSLDGTGKIIDELINEGLPIVKETVKVNQGYGIGVLRGLRSCRGKLVGFMCADEQVDSQDVVRLYEIAAKARTPKLFKVRRRFRLEGPLRRLVSGSYNLITTALFGDLGSMDINASPKVLPPDYLERMNLQSKDWFLDAEVLIKAKRMGLGVFEMNVFAKMRAEGASNVRPATCVEFMINLLKYRFGRRRGELSIQSPQPFECENKSPSGIPKADPN